MFGLVWGVFPGIISAFGRRDWFITDRLKRSYWGTSTGPIAANCATVQKKRKSACFTHPLWELGRQIHYELTLCLTLLQREAGKYTRTQSKLNNIVT